MKFITIKAVTKTITSNMLKLSLATLGYVTLQRTKMYDIIVKHDAITSLYIDYPGSRMRIVLCHAVIKPGTVRYLVGLVARRFTINPICGHVVDSQTSRFMDRQ